MIIHGLDAAQKINLLLPSNEQALPNRLAINTFKEIANTSTIIIQAINLSLLRNKKRSKMKMKMKMKLLVTAAATVMAGTAMAQPTFVGAYGQIGIGYETVSPSLSTSLSVGGVGIPAEIRTSNSNSFAGTITAGYNFAINKNFLLGVGAEYSPIAGNSQNANLTLAGVSADTSVGTYRKTNSYNFFVSPGLVVGDDGLAYAKIGFTGATMREESSDGSSSNNTNGYSLGIGYKQIVKGGLYGFGEVNYASYGKQTNTQTGAIGGRPASASITSSSNVFNVLVGIGYKF